jgi:hypothetical protein
MQNNGVMTRWLVMLAVVWGLVWQPVLSLRLEPSCCRDELQSARESSCCAEVAAAVCADVGAALVAAVEEDCDGCCGGQQPGETGPVPDRSQECMACRAVCALMCGSDWGGEQSPSRSSVPLVDGGVDWPGAVCATMSLPPVARGVGWVDWRGSVALSVGERLSWLCVRTT